MTQSGTWTADLARLKEVLVFAQETGCKVILDPHDYFKNPYTGTEYTAAQLSAFLVPLANEVASYPALVGFTLTNEPLAGNSDYWNIVAKEVILAIHNAQPNLTIVLPGASYSSVTRWWTANPLFPLDLPSTVNVVYEGHIYMDERASGTWGEGAGDTKNRYQTVAPDQGVKMATQWVNWLQHYNLKGFIGECGVPYDNPSALVALDNLLGYLGANKIPLTYWAAGEWWELNNVNAIERGGNFKEQMVILRKHVQPAQRPVPYVPAPIAYGPSAAQPNPDPNPNPNPTPEGALPLVGFNIASTSDNPQFDAAGYPTVAGTAYRLPSADWNRWKALVEPAIARGEPWLARIGIAGERMIGNNNFGALDDEYMNEIIGEINFIYSKGGRVVLDLHNYCRWWKKVDQATYNAWTGTKQIASWSSQGVPNVPLIWAPIGHSSCPITNDGVADMWKKVATRVKDLPGFLAYGTMNEPCRQGDNSFFNVESNWVNVMAQKIVTAIRQVDMKNYITICGVEYASAKNWPNNLSKTLNTLVDPANKLIFEAHQYNDNNNGGGGQWANRYETINIANSLNGVKPFIDWCKAKGVRGYLGEFGGPDSAVNQLEYHRQLQDYLLANKVPFTQWRAGGGMSDQDVLLINRANGTLATTAAPLRDNMGKVTTTGYGPFP